MDPGAELVTDLAGKGVVARSSRALPIGPGRPVAIPVEPGGPLLEGSDGEALADCKLSESPAGIGVPHRQERLGVAQPEPAAADRPPGELIQLVEAKQVADARTVEADPLGQLLMGHAVLIDEPAEGFRPLDGVEVLPLNVLNQCPLAGRSIIDLADHRGQLLKANELGRPPSPLSHHQLVGLQIPAGIGSQHDRLHESRGPDRGRQRLEGLVADSGIACDAHGGTQHRERCPGPAPKTAPK